MLRKAFAVLFALVIMASLTLPVSASGAPTHACCSGHVKKSAPTPGACCRSSLPATAVPAVRVGAPIVALAHSAVVVPVPAVLSVRVVPSAVAVHSTAPPGPTGLSPPARA